MIAKQPGQWQRDLEPLVEAITDERKKQRITQLQLAVMTRRSQATLSYLENLSMDPRLSLLHDLVSALGGTIKYEISWPKGEE